MWGLLGWAAAWAAPGVALGEGVVLDVERETVYVALPDGGVEAVAVQSGRSLWVSAAGDFPLASAGDLVVARRDSTGSTLRIVGLDATRKGRVAVPCADLPLPDGLPGVLDDYLGGSSMVTARVRNHEIEASWAMERHYAGGAYPTPEIEAAARRSWSGSGRCEADGTWTEGSGPPLSPTHRETPVELRGKAGLGQRFGDLWRIAYIAWAGAEGTLRVQTWDIPTATQLSDLALTAVRDPNEHPFLSVDGSRVASVTQGVAPSSRLFDVHTGEPLETLPLVLIAWTKVGETFVSSNGNTVAGYDAGGATVWSRAVRTRAFTGPYPP